MRAVNLIPPDSRRGGRRGVSAPATIGPSYLLVFVLAAAVVLVLIGVLTSNTISSRQAHLATLRAEVAQATAEAGRLSTYTSFEQTAEQRADTVREIAASRFDWDSALTQLSKVVPANTSFQTLDATVSPGGAAGGDSVRGDIDAPAFEITGCTASQDEVARLMSRLRLLSGVTRVTLDSSAKSTSASTGTSATTGAARGCLSKTPTLDVVVFFQPIPNAGPDGLTSLSVTTGGTQ
jgi:Tfp pilus assembly protein PilN